VDRSDLRIVAIVLLVLVIVLLGVPVGFGMSGMTMAHVCPTCDVAVHGGLAACFAVLFVSLVVFGTAFGTTVTAAGRRRLVLGALGAIEHPPRSV
jgi:hypothetical protein